MAELRSALVRADFAPQEIADAVSRLETLGWIADERVADGVALKKSGARAVGTEAFRAFLVQKGVGEEQIERAAERYDETSEIERARSLVRAKFPLAVNRDKIARTLWSRGFAETTIETILEEFEASFEDCDSENRETDEPAL